MVEFWSRAGDEWRAAARFSTAVGAPEDGERIDLERPPGIDDPTAEALRGLENELADRALHGYADRQTMARLVAPDFIQRVGDAPERTLSRDQWGQGTGRCRVESIEQRDFATRVLAEGVAVVSMRLEQRASIAGRDRSGEFHVVDLWMRRDAGWQLVARYSTPIGKMFDRSAPA